VRCSVGKVSVHVTGASAVTVLRHGSTRLRLMPWQGSNSTAYIAAIPGAEPVESAAVAIACEHLATLGYSHVVTGALSVSDQWGFVDAGFSERERLQLLSCRLGPITARAAAARTRRGRDRDVPDVLALDALAFEPFWQLDAAGLVEARQATPSSRFRVSVSPSPGRLKPGKITGYAVTGRSGRNGFLQRLAVHPDAIGQGLGRALVNDGLNWLQRRGVSTVFVNTQFANDRARGLYEAVGFRRSTDDLVVLQRSLSLE
jgi:ribosomal protein S18 acetylase RimI-like enzyme